MLVTFFRHGKSVDAANGLSQHPQSPLTEASIEVLQKVGTGFDKRNYDAIYTSTFLRAQQTAEALFGKGAYKVLEFVHESDMTPHLYKKRHEDAVGYWQTLAEEFKFDPDYRHGEEEGIRGETFNELCARTERFLEFLCERHLENERIVVVGHGIYIRVLLARLLMKQEFSYRGYLQAFQNLRLENGAMLTIDLDKKTRAAVLREMRNWEIM